MEKELRLDDRLLVLELELSRLLTFAAGGLMGVEANLLRPVTAFVATFRVTRAALTAADRTLTPRRPAATPAAIASVAPPADANPSGIALSAPRDAPPTADAAASPADGEDEKSSPDVACTRLVVPRTNPLATPPRDSMATFPAYRASLTIGTSEDTPATAPAAVVTSLLAPPALLTAVARGSMGLNTMGSALIPRLNITDAIDAVLIRSSAGWFLRSAMACMGSRWISGRPDRSRPHVASHATLLATPPRPYFSSSGTSLSHRSFM
mmetsp:Transcript_1409/g.5341  ORF Transcript_1409/g.5341 Transcript_1409/m.5341 type:complete len:267 (-) Transcript_1409:633-1433(-)